MFPRQLFPGINDVVLLLDSGMYLFTQSLVRCASIVLLFVRSRSIRSLAVSWRFAVLWLDALPIVAGLDAIPLVLISTSVVAVSVLVSRLPVVLATPVSLSILPAVVVTAAVSMAVVFPVVIVLVTIPVLFWSVVVLAAPISMLTFLIGFLSRL